MGQVVRVSYTVANLQGGKFLLLWAGGEATGNSQHPAEALEESLSSSRSPWVQGRTLP